MAAANGRVHTNNDATVARRPAIFVNGNQLSLRLRQAVDALQMRNDPPLLYSRGGILTRFNEATGELGELDANGLLNELAEAANWFKRTEKQGLPTPANPSPPVIAALLGMRSWPFPAVENVTRAPFFAADGTLVIRPGYHAGARTYLVLEPRLAEELNKLSFSEEPSNDEVKWALGQFGELFHDFPFVGGNSGSSYAHTLGLTLLPFVRLMIDGPTPNHAVNAPSGGEGTGKGLLIQCACVPGLGLVYPAPEIENRDELRKSLSAAIMEGAAIYWFDNIEGEVRAGVLAAIFTAMGWIDRILGKSKRFSGKVLTTWCVAGNALRFSREILRRTVMILLAANMPRPWERDPAQFLHPLPRWALENRAALIRAAVLLVNNWKTKGRPAGSRSLGSYEEWARVVGGILEAAGVTGFLQKTDDGSAEATNRDTERWTAVVNAWWELQQGDGEQVQARLPKDLLEIAEDVMPRDDKGERSEQSRATYLGNRLRKQIGRVFEVEGCDHYVRIAVGSVERKDKQGHSKGQREGFFLALVSQEQSGEEDEPI